MMRNLVPFALAFTFMTSAAIADSVPGGMGVTPVPLSQIDNAGTRVEVARVIDADGTVIGAVQRVELQGGRPARLDVALLGSENTVSLDAATLRYDAGRNLVSTGQSIGQLMARPQN